MRLILLAGVLLISGFPVFADVAPIRERNPQASKDAESKSGPIQQADGLCMDKKEGDSCLIPVSRWEGGGEGLCRRYDDALACSRINIVWINRQIPCYPNVNGDSRSRCAPTPQPPSDQFCIDKAVGSACTVEAKYGKTLEKMEGVCKASREVVGEAHPYDPIWRDIVICEVPQPKTYQPQFLPVPFWKKLFR